MRMLPPPTGRFQSRAELFEHAQKFANSQRYALVVKRSWADIKVVLRCDRGGTYRNPLNLTDENRQRATGTTKISCPFELYGRKRADGFWYLSVKNSEHNHNASDASSER